MQIWIPKYRPEYLAFLNDVLEFDLKIVRTSLNNSVLGTSTTAIFLSNDHSLYAPIYLYTSDEIHAWVHLYGTREISHAQCRNFLKMYFRYDVR